MVVRQSRGVFTLAWLLVACGATTSASPKPASPAKPQPLPPAEAFQHLEQADPNKTYLELRDNHRTKLRARQSQRTTSLPPLPSDARLVHYPSRWLELAGYWVWPKKKSRLARTVVVYFHHDFELTTEALANARALSEAGFKVFLPALRGENGNPGSAELLLGEVDDARAAIVYAAAQAGTRQVYAIGHSIGGGVVALLSLLDDVPVEGLATVNGIYRARAFHSWARDSTERDIVRFDPNEPDEVRVRLLLPHLEQMKRPLRVYASQENKFDREYAEYLLQEANEVEAPVEVIPVAGDHMESIEPALSDFIEYIKEDLAERAREKRKARARKKRRRSRRKKR